jgi:hypothetical protein
MKRRRSIDFLLTALALVFLALVVREVLRRFRPDIYIFEGISGPAEPSLVQDPVPEDFARYAGGSASRLAVLLTDPESSWLGLAHGLKSMGIPFVLTSDPQRALKHRALLVYPTISGKVLERQTLQELAAFPRKGGTLIGVNVAGGGLNEVFGFDRAVAARNRFEIRFDLTQPLASGLSDPRESVLRIRSDPNQPSGPSQKEGDTTGDPGRLALGTFGYTDPAYAPLALFDDGTAALTQKPYARGKTYAFGIDIGFLMLKGYNYREEGIARSYVNDYEPTLDVLLRLIRDIYREAEPDAVTLSPVPDGKSLAVMITHDVDYPQSLRNSLKYAELEQSRGIRATYFIQTKYIRDWLDEIFFNPKAVELVRKLEARGMEIGSHSVAHAELFSNFPLGDGREQYPTYQPFIRRRREAINGTILGELRISKFLLDHFLDRGEVISFRPGYLSNPPELPQALHAAGFLFTSTITANKSLTHLPFQLNYSRGFEAEVGIYEFPVTVEDEHRPKLGDRLSQALELAEKIGRQGGIFVVLIHPDILGHKFEFEEAFIDSVRDSAWFGSVSDFGRWWSARDKVELDVSEYGRNTRIANLEIPISISGLTLEVPGSYSFLESRPNGLEIRQNGRDVWIKEARGRIQLEFRR